MTPLDKEREAFEVWFTKAYPNGVILGQLSRYERGETLLLPSIQAFGDYKNSWVQGSWEGWSARASLAAESETPLTHDLDPTIHGE